VPPPRPGGRKLKRKRNNRPFILWGSWSFNRLQLFYFRQQAWPHEKLELILVWVAVTSARSGRRTDSAHFAAPATPSSTRARHERHPNCAEYIGGLPSVARRRDVLLRLRSAKRSSPPSAPLSPLADHRPKPHQTISALYCKLSNRLLIYRMQAVRIRERICLPAS
jgi:hypothetical protein